MVLNAHKTIYISESVRNFQSLLKLGIWKSRPKTIWTVASQSNYSHDLLIYTVFSNWISKTSVNNWYQSVPAQKTGDARDQDLHECCTASYFWLFCPSVCMYVLTVQTINSPQQELYVIRYIPTSEQSDASQSGSFKGTTKVFFRLHNLSLSEAYWRAYI